MTLSICLFSLLLVQQNKFIKGEFFDTVEHLLKTPFIRLKCFTRTSFQIIYVHHNKAYRNQEKHPLLDRNVIEIKKIKFNISNQGGYKLTTTLYECLLSKKKKKGKINWQVMPVDVIYFIYSHYGDEAVFTEIDWEYFVLS